MLRSAWRTLGPNPGNRVWPNALFLREPDADPTGHHILRAPHPEAAWRHLREPNVAAFGRSPFASGSSRLSSAPLSGAPLIDRSRDCIGVFEGEVDDSLDSPPGPRQRANLRRGGRIDA